MHAAFIVVPSSNNIKMQCKQTCHMLELTIFLPWLMREGFIHKLSFLRVTQSPLRARQKCGRRKKASQQERQDPQGNCRCPAPGGLLELPTRGSPEHAVRTLQLPTIRSWSPWTISQKGWTLSSLLCIFKD